MEFHNPADARQAGVAAIYQEPTMFAVRLKADDIDEFDF